MARLDGVAWGWLIVAGVGVALAAHFALGWRR